MSTLMPPAPRKAHTSSRRRISYSSLIEASQIAMDMRLSSTYNTMASVFGPQALRASSVPIDTIAAQRAGTAYATKTGMTLSKTTNIPPANGYLIAPQLCVDTQSIWSKILAFESTQPNSTKEDIIQILNEQKNIFTENGDHANTNLALTEWIKKLNELDPENPLEELRHIISHSEIPKNDPHVKFTKLKSAKSVEHDGFNQKDRSHLLENIVEKSGDFRQIQIKDVTECLESIFLKAHKKDPDYCNLRYIETLEKSLDEVTHKEILTTRRTLYFQSTKDPKYDYCISLSEENLKKHANDPEQFDRSQLPFMALQLQDIIQIPEDLKEKLDKKKIEYIQSVLHTSQFTTLPVTLATRVNGELQSTEETVPVLADYQGRPFFGDWDSLFQAVPLERDIPIWATIPLNTFQDPIHSIERLEAFTRELARTLLVDISKDESMKALIQKLVIDGYVHHIHYMKNDRTYDTYILDDKFFVPFISQRAGCITPYEFLVGQLTNYAYRGSKAFTDPTANPKQHGNEVRNPYPPSNIDGAISHHMKMPGDDRVTTTVTHSEQSCSIPYKSDLFLDKFALDINPKWDHEIWGPLIFMQMSKAIENIKNKNPYYIPPGDVMLSYLKHNAEEKNANEKDVNEKYAEFKRRLDIAKTLTTHTISLLRYELQSKKNLESTLDASQKNLEKTFEEKNESLKTTLEKYENLKNLKSGEPSKALETEEVKQKIVELNGEIGSIKNKMEENKKRKEAISLIIKTLKKRIFVEKMNMRAFARLEASAALRKTSTLLISPESRELLDDKHKKEEQTPKEPSEHESSFTSRPGG